MSSPTAAGRDAPSCTVAGDAARLLRALSAGGGGAAHQDPWRGTQEWDPSACWAGFLEWVCRRQMRNDSTFADGRQMQAPRQPVRGLGRMARLGDATWDVPMLAQVAGIAVDEVTMPESVVAAPGSNQQPVAIVRSRIDRQTREVALEHAAAVWATTQPRSA